MFKKVIITAFAAITMMVGLQAPASAAMAVAKPAVALTEAVESATKVGYRRHGYRRFHWRRHHGWYKRRFYGGRWAAYRHCKWKQRQGYRIRCYRPVRYYY